MPTDFSSLDKLVEFGLGVGIATQMMNTMNHSIAQTAVPGVGINPGLSSNVNEVKDVAAPAGVAPKPQASAEKSYYIVKDERMAGPLSEHELGELVKKGVVSYDTFCWYNGLNSWKFAEDIPEVNKLLLLFS